VLNWKYNLGVLKFSLVTNSIFKSIRINFGNVALHWWTSARENGFEGIN